MSNCSRCSGSSVCTCSGGKLTLLPPGRPRIITENEYLRNKMLDVGVPYLIVDKQFINDGLATCPGWYIPRTCEGSLNDLVMTGDSMKDGFKQVGCNWSVDWSKIADFADFLVWNEETQTLEFNFGELNFGEYDGVRLNNDGVWEAYDSETGTWLALDCAAIMCGGKTLKEYIDENTISSFDGFAPTNGTLSATSITADQLETDNEFYIKGSEGGVERFEKISASDLLTWILDNMTSASSGFLGLLNPDQNGRFAVGTTAFAYAGLTGILIGEDANGVVDASANSIQLLEVNGASSVVDYGSWKVVQRNNTAINGASLTAHSVLIARIS